MNKVTTVLKGEAPETFTVRASRGVGPFGDAALAKITVGAEQDSGDREVLS